MALELNSLQKAVASLGRSVAVALSSEKMDAFDSDTQEAIKAGVIQNFEFTYELCWKLMKRWLAHNVGETYVDGVTRRELFRLSAEYHLIRDVDLWMDYHKDRNRTSHTYDEETAAEVFNSATEFYHEAKKFQAEITKRND
ncbi:MAG: nucleotidyltransferase substrate binding protein [Magnetococcales bacterium]|nr:nucleotidyltransferase substrate binding protein [Magnetococcales bacterium]